MNIPQFTLVFIIVNLLPALAIVFYFTRESSKAGLIDKLVMAVLLSPLVLVLVSFVEEVLGIPQGRATLTFNIAVAAAANIYLMLKYFSSRRHFALRLSWARLAAYGLFVALFLFRVLPTQDLLTPILHDPIAHSEWLKYININHFTTKQQWYPQGLEYYLNYYATFLDVSYPQAVLTSLNVHLALYPVSMFYLGVLSFRGRQGDRDRWLVYAFIMFTIAALLPRPTELYFLAGKNSMLFVFSVAPLIIYLSTSARNRLDYIVATALVSACIIIHYPTGAVLAFILFFTNLVSVVGFRGRRLTLDREKLGAYLAAMAAMAVFGVLLLMQIVPKYLELPISEDGTVSVPQPFITEHGALSFAFLEFIRDRMSILGMWPLAALAVSALALLLFPGANRRMPLKVLISYLLLYILGVVLLLLPDKTVGVFFMAEMKHFLPIIIAIVVAWFAYFLLDWSILRVPPRVLMAVLVIAALAAVFIYGGREQYREYNQASRDLWSVNQDDLDAFAYIDSQLPDDALILIQLGSPGDLSGVIAGADGGVWIPSFTGKQVEVSFLEFSSKRSAEIFDLYMAVARDRDDEQAIRSLYCDYGIDYVYFGSRPVYFNHMQREMLDTSSYFEKIYDKGATIYRIKPLACDA